MDALLSEKPLVSIITPTYNSELYIAETIESILGQSYTSWELLITDDCSTDNTVEILKKYEEQDSRIKYFQLNTNSGAGAARNNSIKNANGRFIAFCDSDDRWLPQKLFVQLNLMLSKKLSFTYSAYNISNEKGDVIKLKKVPKTISYFSTLVNNDIGCLTVVYDTLKLGKVYMPKIRKRQDWATWLQIMKSIRYTEGISLPLAIYRIHSGSISSNKIKLIRYNYSVFKNYLEYNHILSILLMILFLANYFIKKIKNF